jgi:dTMP kinase
MVLGVTPPGAPDARVTGRYIALEGAEACGKSTHAARLADDLGALCTRETGGTRIGVKIRDILHDAANIDLADKAEVLLIAADRAQHMQEVVAPALEAGRDVVSDRSAFSSLAYQGYGRGVPIDVVRSTNDWALGGRWPDLVLLIDVPAEILAERMAGRDLDRFELADDAFHGRVRAGFAEMARTDPSRWVIIDGTSPTDDVAASIRRAVSERLGI